MSQQLFMRDDIIQFNNKLDSQGYNVKAYRKRKSKSKKLSLLAPTTTDIDQSQDSLNPNVLNILKSMDKTQFQFDKISERRVSMTAALKKRNQNTSQDYKQYNKSINMRTQIASHKKQLSTGVNQVKTAKINYSSNKPSVHHYSSSHEPKKLSVASMQQSETKPLRDREDHLKINNLIFQQESMGVGVNKYKQLQSKFHKSGPINDKAIQNWLNQILVEYCNEESFDKSIENAALKKMSLDRNSLLSQGIKPEYVNRVYKSMFVYSIGFNNLLKELSGKNGNLKKTIWKVYAILLQFCSEGSFETMIGEIERDKTRKVQSLRFQIQKRQVVIENNDEINEEKNAKIFKELKLLREQNANLESEKNVLLQDFKEAEQSFNQQVSLRLKFENKINQIHGIHHQLATKHSRLYEDHQKNVEHYQALQYNHKILNEQYLTQKEKLARVTEQLSTLKEESVADKQLISNYEQMRSRFENSQIQLKNSKDDLLNIIKEKSRRISQLEVQMQNGGIMLNLCKSSANQLQTQYRQSLEQNRKCHETIHDQIEQLNELFGEKKKFNQKHMGYVSEIQFLKNKDSENKINIEKLKKEIKDQVENIQNLTLENFTLIKKVQSLNSDLKDCHTNIDNMKRTKNLYEEELNYLKKLSQIHGQVVREKEQYVANLLKNNQKLTKQNEQFMTLNKTLDSKTTVLTQRLRSQEQINRKKYEKLKAERDQLFNEKNSYDSVLQNKVNQLERYISLYDKEALQLKNERFERLNLDMRYKQSLQVMENENEHIRKLNITISENYEEIEQWKRKYRNFQYVFKEKVHLYEVERSTLKTHLDQARQQIVRKKLFVNPMLLEDLKGQLQRAIQNIVRLKRQLELTLRKFRQFQFTSQKEKQSSKELFDKQLQESETLSKKRLDEKNYELEYQKEKSKHLQQKIIQLQKLIQGKAAEGPDSLKSMKQKEKKYLNTIKQKSIEIEKLLKQLENAHDHNNTVIKRLSNMEETINEKNIAITELEKQITQLMQSNQALEKQMISGGSRLQRQTPSSKLEDYDQALSAMNPKNSLNPAQSNRQESNNRERTTSSKSKTPFSRQRSQCKDRQTMGIEEFKESQSKNKGEKQKLSNPAWRNDFSKKIKNAFNYYQKI